MTIDEILEKEKIRCAIDSMNHFEWSPEDLNQVMGETHAKYTYKV